MSNGKIEMTADSKFGDCACFNLRRANRQMTQAYDQTLAPSNLKTTQFSLLAVLAGAGEGVAISALAEKLGMDRTTLTRNLAVVERAGFVSLKPGEDPRTKLVNLTAQGRKAFEDAAPLWREAQAAAMERLGDDWGKFLEMTRRIASG